MLERLLEVKDSLIAVLDELAWDNLGHSEWKLVECVSKLLKPFAVYMSSISCEEFTTISSALSILMELNLHLENMKKVPEVAEISISSSI